MYQIMLDKEMLEMFNRAVQQLKSSSLSAVLGDW